MQQLEIKQIINTVVVLSACAILTGCVTPLSQEEKAQTHTISISSSLGDKLGYMQSGMTVFAIKTQTIADEGMLSSVVSKTSEILRGKGYAVTTEGTPCDYVLLIEPATVVYGGNTYAEGAYTVDGPRMEMKGAHFLTSKLFGACLPINARSDFLFKLKRPNTDKIRIAAIAQSSQLTDIRKSGYWEELSEGDRRRLLEIMKAQLLTIPEQGIKKLGL